MKRIIYILMLCLSVSACSDDTVGYLDTSAACYDPNFMEVRNSFLFFEKKGWTETDYYHHLYPEWYPDDPVEPVPEQEMALYTADYGANRPHYLKNVPWISQPIQCIIGTQPIFVSLVDVTSPDGGDLATFRKEVSVRGDGSIVVPHGKVPVGTYMISLKIENEGRSTILKDIFKITVVGPMQPKEPEESEE